MQDQTDSRTKMWCQTPAADWHDALPSGNGTLGALVYGGIGHETILINHERLWTHRPSKKEMPDISAHLGEVREALRKGDYSGANTLYPDLLKEKGYVTSSDSYQPGFDIQIVTATQAAFRNYRRSLEMSTGEVAVEWEDGGQRFVRSLFVSCIRRVVVLRVASPAKGKVSLFLQLKEHDLHDAVDREGNRYDPPYAYQTAAKPECLTICGKREDGTEFGAMAHVIAEGGEATAGQDGIRVEAADSVLVLADVFAEGPAADRFPRMHDRLWSIPEDYDALLAEHVPAHRRIFSRLQLDLNEGSRREKSNEQLLLDGYSGDVPTALLERMFYYGRYLLVSSSRPGGLPANLQGIWNGDYSPAWNCAFFFNENIQMCYWQALQGNMPEVILPLFDFLEAHIRDFRENARAYYGCRGILLPLYMDHRSGLKKSRQPHVVYWTAGAGWISQFFYDYYLFTGDTKFLRKRAVPFMKEAALFYEDFLTEGPDGQYTVMPSNSPENCANGSFEGAGKTAVCINATMDFAVIRELLTHLCEACEKLGSEDAGTRTWREMLKKMPDYQVNADGAIREWMHPDFRDNYHHRHQSHLYPVFPGNEITKEKDPRLFHACGIAVDKRLVTGLREQTGWSLAHMANIYARLGRGDRSLECLELLCRCCTGENGFTYHNDWRNMGVTIERGYGKRAPFQIDANMGLSAAVMEMLLYSDADGLKVLPALPTRWKRGRIDRILCRCGAEASVQWDAAAGEIELRLISPAEHEIAVRFAGTIDAIDADIPVRKTSPSGIQVRLPAGAESVVKVRLAERTRVACLPDN